MCPFCFATVGLIVAGAVSTGGLATLALKVSEEKSDSTQIKQDSNERSTQNAG